MPRTIWISLLLVAVLGLAATTFWFSEPPSAPSQAATPNPSAQPSNVGASVAEAVVEPSSNTQDAEDPDDDNTEIVMGLRVRKDRNCEVTRQYVDLGDGRVTESFACVTEPEPGKYDHYTNEELAVLSYDTADAAAELGRRLHESDPLVAKNYMLRALALEPDNVNPVRWLAGVSFSLRGDSDQAKEAIANDYVLRRVLSHFEDSANPAFVVRDGLEAGMSRSDFETLEQVVQHDLNTIRQIQIEVSGETTLAEDAL